MAAFPSAAGWLAGTAFRSGRRVSRPVSRPAEGRVRHAGARGNPVVRRMHGGGLPRGRTWLAAALALLVLLGVPQPRSAAGGAPASIASESSAPGRSPAPRAGQAQGLDGRRLGDFRLTYYRLAQARHSEGNGTLVPVYGRNCGRVLAWVSERFHSDLGLQGSGMLADGRLLNFEQRCPCAAPTRRGERICYEELRRSDYPFGRGAPLSRSNPWQRQFFWLQPYRSAAVDPLVVPLGTVLYIPALRDKRMAHGAAHTGCVRAEDTGQAIRGRRLDVFAGGGPPSPDLPRTLPDRPVPVYVDARRCVGAFP